MVMRLISFGSLSPASPRRCVCSSHTAVSMETTVLNRSTEPRSVERSTSFSVLASVNGIEGKAAPIVKGLPSSLYGAPLNVTWVPGLTDSEVISIFLAAAHPIPSKAKRIKAIGIFVFTVFLLSKTVSYPSGRRPRLSPLMNLSIIITENKYHKVPNSGRETPYFYPPTQTTPLSCHFEGDSAMLTP